MNSALSEVPRPFSHEMDRTIVRLISPAA